MRFEDSVISETIPFLNMQYQKEDIPNRIRKIEEKTTRIKQGSKFSRKQLLLQ